VICGDAIFVGPLGPEGEETPCPDEIVSIVGEWGWLP
jgi:hypothetical protein